MIERSTNEQPSTDPWRQRHENETRIKPASLRLHADRGAYRHRHYRGADRHAVAGDLRHPPKGEGNGNPNRDCPALGRDPSLSERVPHALLAELLGSL